MKSLLKSITSGKKVLILGYGREGSSTLRLLHKTCPELNITVADANSRIAESNPELIDERVTIICGPGYLDGLDNFDLVIKSPGISFHKAGVAFNPEKISSQTDLFLRAYASQTVGITGTKGKSTTSSLLYHIIKTYTSDCLLAGNIGLPLFELVPHITPQTRIVCELSSHQLEFIHRAPHIAILLNLFQEHLDHYASFRDYQLSKLQIGYKQQVNDLFIFTAGDENIIKRLQQQRPESILLPLQPAVFEGNGIGISGDNLVLRIGEHERIVLPALPESRLPGVHNLLNIMAASAAASLMKIPAQAIAEGVAGFVPLEHRIEFAGTFNNKSFYNDSISTIPEATLAALLTLKNVDTLILGGFDRGIDYAIIVDYLIENKGLNVVFTGPAGKRIKDLLPASVPGSGTKIFAGNFDKAVETAVEITPEGGICLLSPAASSYDSFKNFEERGRRFKELVKAQKKQTPGQTPGVK